MSFIGTAGWNPETCDSKISDFSLCGAQLLPKGGDLSTLDHSEEIRKLEPFLGNRYMSESWATPNPLLMIISPIGIHLEFPF